MINTAYKIIDECFNTLKQKGVICNMAYPHIIETSMKSKWAEASSKVENGAITENIIKINKDVFCNKHNTDVFRKTIIHEFCHLLVNHYYFGKVTKENAHGEQWQKFMQFFGVEPHQFISEDDVNQLGSVTKTMTRYLHMCECQPHLFTKKQHDELLFNGVTYTCPSCNTKVKRQFHKVNVRVK